MRLTTEIWVSALTRRVFAEGGFAAVARRGATEAGAVLVAFRGRGGEIVLYAPAPQTSYGEAGASERRFVEVPEIRDDEALGQRIEREKRFDPDFWLVEIEGTKTAADELIGVVPG